MSCWRVWRRFCSRGLQWRAHILASFAWAETGKQLAALHNMCKANSKYSLLPNTGISNTMRNTFNKLSVLSDGDIPNTRRSNSMVSANVTRAWAKADSNASPKMKTNKQSVLIQRKNEIYQFFLKIFGFFSLPGKDHKATKALRTACRSTLVSSGCDITGVGSLLSSSLSSPWRDRTASLLRSPGGPKSAGARLSSAVKGESFLSVIWKLRRRASDDEKTSPRVRINRE